MSQYMADNPQIIVNGFRHTGISHALDGKEADESEYEADASEDESAEEVF